MTIDASTVEPTVTWGTSPEDVVAIGGVVPAPESFADPAKQTRRAGEPRLHGPRARPEDDRRSRSRTSSSAAAPTAASRTFAPPPPCSKGRRKADNIRWGIVVPGSGLVKKQAEEEGLDKVFIDAGLEWREPGCSACLGMNPDKVPPGERSASTSNRNFVGRQGPGARTHLVSPAMAAAAAVTGKLTDVRELVD